MCTITSLSFASVVFIGDVVEYAKKLSGYSGQKCKTINSVRFLNLPKMLMEILPFVFLFGGMLWTIRVNRNRELLIMRTSGLSLFKRQSPLIFFIFILVGILFIFTFSPLISKHKKNTKNRIGKT